MGNCPFCGAELGFGIAICPNCGGQIGGESSEATETEEMDTASDTIGDSIGGGEGQGGAGGGASGHQGGVQGPASTTRPAEQVERPVATDRVADDAEPNYPVEVDSSIPGSDVPPSHGGGYTQQGEDGTAPPEITRGLRADQPTTEFPEDPRPDLGLDDSGRRLKPRFNAGLGLAAILIIVIVALAGWYIWGGDGNGDDNGEPNGNGPDPYEGLHVVKDGTSGTYPYEPPGEYHVTVALRNNGSNSVDLSKYQVSITVWIDSVSKGNKVEPLSGPIAAGETRTFDVVVDTEMLGGGDQLLVGVTLRKVEDAKHVHTINFEDTV